MGRRFLRGACVATVATLGFAPAQAAAPVEAVHPESWPAAHSRGLVDPRTEAFVDELMGRMSLEEKVGQLIQADVGSIRPEDLREFPLGSILAGGDSPPLGAPDRSPAQAWLATARAFRTAAAQARPGRPAIPLIFGVDAVHGNNNVVGATIFPHNIGLGAARDPDLIRDIGRATANEAAAVGIDWTFGPTVAVVRDDRWGRTYEGYSEDPEVVAGYARALVTGLQGTPAQWPSLQAGRIAGSAKHFLGDGGSANGRDQGDNLSSEAELARLNAPGYAAAIDAGVMTVMASFSSWRGVKLHGHRGLLTDVLKGRMGFDGFVVGDWNAHGQVPGCTTESCPQAVNAGLDMLMAPDSWKGLYRNTLAQARSGEIPMARLDDAVRRILRVKAKAGLFGVRPLEGKLELVGAPEHRALARRAVAESLVLLKNNGGVLPISAKARVLVAGDGADNVGKQAGGWTLSWQGTGNKPADFPNAQSIWEGVRDAVAAGGGQAELSPDGRFATRPDVAIVVFGEDPYAEFQGDRATLEYQPGAKSDLALLRKLKAQGVPVVAVFLSGRPLWVNPEFNVADAFVAAWLPGSEGGGVADVLVGDARGRPRSDFRGKLSFSWPRRADQFSLNRGDARYDPLFAYGYGLTYRDSRTVPQLPEISGVAAVAENVDRYLAGGQVVAPWRLVLRDAGGDEAVPGAGAGASPQGALAVRLVDAAGVQGAGRALAWTGEGRAVFAGPEVDLRRQANGDMALLATYRVDRRPTGAVRLGIGGASVPLQGLLGAAQSGEWRTIKVRLSCFRAGGEDLAAVTSPAWIEASGGLELALAELRLAPNQNDAVCP
ncbi:MAG: glycoside hydrolase family 3 protein [Phenylobacterium sp.]|uniref:glycoside hydrolase family 3 protein n=1 Tax=Phenylobacterium sp. TaxID=1871053 RepID=UPI0012115B76|nr:exo 1,3/1,4-beta-D-glucan glucohydrolase [Phenylobacterium sp.]TAJ70800.1 MAG: glycoside hydrolase family 3 protein [Phenylobacterium sp.]